MTFLCSFGAFFVAVLLWQAMSRFAPWIEPAVFTVWVEIMRSYEDEPYFLGRAFDGAEYA